MSFFSDLLNIFNFFNQSNLLFLVSFFLGSAFFPQLDFTFFAPFLIGFISSLGLTFFRPSATILSPCDNPETISINPLSLIPITT